MMIIILSDIIKSANVILSQLTVPTRVQSIDELSSDLFVTLYEGLCGERLPGKCSTENWDGIFPLHMTSQWLHSAFIGRFYANHNSEETVSRVACWVVTAMVRPYNFLI